MSRLFSRRLVVLALLAALTMGVVACGGSDNKSSGADADATTLLKDTFGADHPIRSGRLDANLDVDLKGLARITEPLSLHLNGPFQSNGGKTLPDFALGLDLQGGEKPITVGAVFADGGGYLTIEGQAFDLGADLYKTFKTGYEKAKASASSKSAGDNQASLSALGISPLRWLQDPKNVGTEDIAGTQTVHLASGVNVAKLLEDISTLLGKAKGVTSAGSAATGTAVPMSLTAQQRDVIAKSIKSAKVDVWTGAKDHTLRKVAVNVQVDVPKELRAKAGNLQTGHVIFQVTIAQLNQDQKIVKPANVRPISELRSALSDLGLLGAGGTASTTTPETTTTPGATTTPATPPATTGPQSDYTQCITNAGEDLARVQDCAQYLNK
ncbi:MAG TPA: hypothetical protein VFY45_26815 [Baekduia sp.]|nr:hypothetical protein [Baekduia sp.]